MASHPSVVVDNLETPPASPVSNPLNDASPFQEHLDTNYAPSCEEIAELRILTGAQQAIQADLDERIGHLKEKVSRLEEEKRPMTHFIRSHNILMHPLRRLPLELIQRIFFHCSNANILGSMNVSLAPMILTTICQSWRRIALNTPALWTRIHVLLYPPSIESDDVFSQHLVSVNNWLSRSGSLPLTIFVVEVRPASSFTMHPQLRPRCPRIRISEAFNILYRHVSRWDHLHIHGGTTVMEPYADVPHTELVALKSIYFVGTDDDDEAHVFGTTNDPSIELPLLLPKFFGAPLLRKINIVSVFQPSRTARFIPFPGTQWANITSLMLGVMVPVVDLHQFLLLFSPGNVLEDVTFALGSYHRVDATPPSAFDLVVEFPRLKRLAVSEQVRGFSWFGAAIRCPVLQQLEYHPYPYRPSAPSYAPRPVPHHQLPVHKQTDDKTNSFLSLMSHSPTFIQSLTFDPKRYSPVEMLNCLASCPELRTLILVQSRNTGPRWVCGQYRPPIEPPLAFFNKLFLQALMSPFGILEGQILCPRLSIFACDFYEVSFTLEDFVEFLRVKQSGRLEGVEKLERFVVQFSSTVEKDLELRDEAISLVEGGASNAHLLFHEKTAPKSSIRDGIQQGRIQHAWYAKRVDALNDSFY